MILIGTISVDRCAEIRSAPSMAYNQLWRSLDEGCRKPRHGVTRHSGQTLRGKGQTFTAIADKHYAIAETNTSRQRTDTTRWATDTTTCSGQTTR